MWTLNCGCKVDGFIDGGCFGHGDDDYCWCPSPTLEDGYIAVPCKEHGGE